MAMYRLYNLTISAVSLLATLAALMFVPEQTKAAADAAHFWLSTSSSGSSGPEAPTIGLTVGSTDTLYLWGRPTTGNQIRNFSLNVIASAGGLDLVDGTFLINNTISGGSMRFEYLDDSTNATVAPLTSEHLPAAVLGGTADELYGLSGFTLFPSSTARGVGPVCTAGESDCETAGDGETAWVIAELRVDALAAGTVNLNLQIGSLGISEATLSPGDIDFDGTVGLSDLNLLGSNWGSSPAEIYEGDLDGDNTVGLGDLNLLGANWGDTSTFIDSASVDVRFGSDPGAGTEPKHNASTDRGTNLAGDDPDVVFTITAPSTSVPEPSALLLAWVAISALSCQGRQR